MNNQWLIRIESALSAHFNMPDGESRPGVHWSIGLKNENEIYTVLVKTLFTDDATAETQEDVNYQSQVAMQYINDQINNGWHPSQIKEHVIYIGNPI